MLYQQPIEICDRPKSEIREHQALKPLLKQFPQAVFPGARIEITRNEEKERHMKRVNPDFEGIIAKEVTENYEDDADALANVDVREAGFLFYGTTLFQHHHSMPHVSREQWHLEGPYSAPRFV